MAEIPYRRLTRSRARSLFGVVSTSRSSLWVGPDHLLSIDTTGYTERYKRFHFRDIQAIIIRRTESWKVAGLVFGLIALLLGMIALATGEPVVGWIFGPLAGLFALAFALNLAAGPSCAAFLRTAVQTEQLVSLKRLRRARRALERLRPAIAAAQGQMTPEEIRDRWRAANAIPAGSATSADGSPATADQPAPAPSEPPPEAALPTGTPENPNPA